LGTLRGSPGGVDDLLYRSVVGELLERGCNVFDTALSDRAQTSERALGHALRRAVREGITARDEIVLISKGGQLTPNPDCAYNPAVAQRDLYSTYIDSGIVDLREITRGHSMAPSFLLDQIERSRRNLGVETIDYYLVQEPEIHLRELGADGFRAALQRAFEALESAVARGWIAAYGLATWDGFLLPDSDRSHLSIVDLFDVALDVGSADHHLRALQLPYGLAMGEGAVLESQLGPDGHSRAILDSLRDTGTAVFASAPLYGGRLVGHVPGFVRDAFPETPSEATTALQFVRSTAGVTTAVVGMRDTAHVEDNMRLRKIARARPELPARLFAQAHARSAARA
jgi:aryl-alcohol dehydrogenase-like predicted oxidoreductase